MKMEVCFLGACELSEIKRVDKPTLWKIDMMGGSELCQSSDLPAGEYKTGLRISGVRGFDGKCRESKVIASLK